MKPFVEDPLAKDLERSLVDQNLASLGADYGELVIDSLVDDPSLQKIPVFGTLVGLYKASKGIANRILLKKLLIFLRELHDVPEAKRRDQVLKLDADPEYAGSVGETLLLLLDKHTNQTKAALLARAFRAYLLELISYQDFLRLANALDRFDITFLGALKAFYGKPPLPIDAASREHMFSCGFLRLDFSLVGTFGGGKPTYERNDLGEIFHLHVLSERTSATAFPPAGQAPLT